MTTREYFVQRRQAEQPVFLDVLKALPPEKYDYKPHDRSPSTQQLVWTIAAELKACLDVVDNRQAEWKEIPPPPPDEMISLFERWSNELTEKVSKMDETGWTENAKFLYNGQVVSEQPVGEFLWFIHFDAIHHRGQLSTYIRPMGGKVPAIYGPSADSAAASA